MAPLAAFSQLKNIYSNETSDSKFLDDLRNQLSGRCVGLYNRTTSSSLDKGQSTAVNLKPIIVIRIVNLLGRKIGMAVASVLACKLLIPSFGLGPGAQNAGDACP